jgi:REP element-mobilizing transposase RayT
MPDHLHALIEGESEDSDLSAFVSLAKQFSGFEFRKKTGKKLWRTDYWDSTVRGRSDSTEIIRYIVMNPVRAGLVATPSEYPSWGSETSTREALLARIGLYE